jgi:hypothetical protein
LKKRGKGAGIVARDRKEEGGKREKAVEEGHGKARMIRGKIEDGERG